MIECANCESPQWVQIVESKIRLNHDGTIDRFKERYECTLCGSTGHTVQTQEKSIINGDMRDNGEKPLVVA